MTGRCRHVVVVGRDGALWLCAAAIRQALAPAGVDVTAVELPTRLGPASVHAMFPAIEALHAKLGLNEAELLRTTCGSFSLGWNIRTERAAPFFIAHGAYGAPIEGSDFFPYWVKARRFGLEAALDDFSPTAMAARYGRILLPDENTGTFGRTDYGYHLPAIPYAAALKSLAIRLGVAAHQVLRVGIERGSGTGLINAVIGDGGDPITGELFVDASGADAALIGALEGATEDWRPFFPFDWRFTGRAKRYASLAPYAELRLSAAGWTALHATQLGTHIVHAYRSSSKSAPESNVAALGLELEDLALQPIAPSARSNVWVGNCVAIGASACALDPLFDPELHAVQLGLVHLLSLFPTKIAADAERAEYNRVMRSLFERLRDFQSAFYLLGGYSHAAPAPLEHKLEAFRARGTIAPMEDETFTPDQWRALFVGLGLMPESWPPAIDRTSGETMKAAFRRILGFVRDKVLEQPLHEAFLANIGASEAK